MARKSEHPSYPNPTIVEALCEVHFVLSSEQPWKPSLPGEFFKRIQKDYPEMEPVHDLAVQFEVGPHGLGQRVLPARPQIRFTHKTGKFLIQLAESVLTVNALAPYPGWASMQPYMLQAWTQAATVLQPTGITRVGLRYINRIPRASAEDGAGNWLRANDYIPAAVLRSDPGFLSRVEIQQDAQNSVIVTLADQPLAMEGDLGAILFDIDRIRRQTIAASQSRPEEDDGCLARRRLEHFRIGEGKRARPILGRNTLMSEVLVEYAGNSQASHARIYLPRLGTAAFLLADPCLVEQEADASPVPNVSVETKPGSEPIWDLFDEIWGGMPEEELRKLPQDGAAQHDHYIYGLPKRVE